MINVFSKTYKESKKKKKLFEFLKTLTKEQLLYFCRMTPGYIVDMLAGTGQIKDIHDAELKNNSVCIHYTLASGGESKGWFESQLLEERVEK